MTATANREPEAVLMSLSARRVFALLALGLSVFGICYGATLWTGEPAVVGAVWPANAVVLAFMMRFCRTRGERGVALLVGGGAMVFANEVAGRAFLTSIGFPVGNMIEIGLAAWFLRNVPMPMSRTSDLKQFFLGAVVAGPLASSLVAGAVLSLAYGTQGLELLRASSAWLLSDMMGMAIVTPVLLALSQIRQGRWLHALRTPLLIGLVIFLASVATRIPVLLLAFPLVGLAAMNDRARGAALGVGAAAAAIVVATAFGRGPVSNLADMGVELSFVIQAFLGCLVLTVYPLAALVRRQDQLAQELELRRHEAELTADARGRALGEAGEELRSPLTGVVTIAEMLRSGRLGDLNSRQVDLLTRIAESGAEIEALSREMMAKARGEPAVERAASIAQVVARAVEGTRFRAARAGVAIEAAPVQEGLGARFDPDHLSRLLADHIGAAVAASPRGGAVRVSVQERGERVRVHIDDAGADPDLRLATFALACKAPLASGAALDRAELRRLDGDLKLVRSDLGGVRVSLILPTASGVVNAA